MCVPEQQTIIRPLKIDVSTSDCDTPQECWASGVKNQQEDRSPLKALEAECFLNTSNKNHLTIF